MSDKIIINPERVRGLGNICSQNKTSSDFILNRTSISMETETIEEQVFNVFKLERGLGVLDFTITPSAVTQGETITLTATLHDDEGYILANEEVSFYKNETLLGTVNTDYNGVAIYEYTTTNRDYENVDFSATIEGINTFQEVYVERAPIDHIYVDTGTEDPVVSVYNNESRLVGAMVYDTNNKFMPDIPVTFLVDGNVVASAVTNDGGFAYFTYRANGSGAVTITATAENVVSNDWIVQDYWYYHKSQISYTNTSTTSENKSPLAIGVPYTDNWVLEFNYKGTGYGGRVQLGASEEDSSAYDYYAGIGEYNGAISTQMRDTVSHGASSGVINEDVWYHMKIVKEGYICKYYVDDELIATYDFTWRLTDIKRYDLYCLSWKSGSMTISELSLTVTEIDSVPVVSGLSLIPEKTVLSKYNDEYSTILAAVVDQFGNPMGGQTVTFYEGSTEIDRQPTGSEGMCSSEYASQGVGDVTITAECGEISESITIEDCIYASLKEQRFTNGGSSTKVGSAIAENVLDMSKDWYMEFDIKGKEGAGCLNIGAQGQYSTSNNSASYRLSIGMDYVNSAMVYAFNVRTTTSNGTYPSSPKPSQNTYYHMQMFKEGTIIRGLHSTGAIATKTATWLGNYSKYDLYPICWSRSGSEITVKNIKIKPLA